MDRIGENGVNKEPRRQVGKLGHGSYERRCGENVWLARTSTTTVRLHGMEFPEWASQDGFLRMRCMSETNRTGFLLANDLVFTVFSASR